MDTSTTFEPRKETTDGVLNQAESVVEQVKARGNELVEDTVDLVRRHPGKTLAISVLLGAAIGAAIVASMADEPTVSEKFSDLGIDSWEKVKDAAEGALSTAREALDSFVSKFR